MKSVSIAISFLMASVSALAATTNANQEMKTKAVTAASALGGHACRATSTQLVGPGAGSYQYEATVICGFEKFVFRFVVNEAGVSSSGEVLKSVSNPRLLKRQAATQLGE